MQPRFAAAEVYQQWCALVHSDDETQLKAIHTLQWLYAPLRWQPAVQLIRSTFGSDLFHYEHRIRGVKVTVISYDPLECHPSHHASTSSRKAARNNRNKQNNHNSSIPDRPTILFVPGGAFIADFEACDVFFLYKWVREAQATLIYITYEFAPQAPYPTGMLQVAAVYRALREGTHDHVMGFRPTPLVMSGLSAGGNLAVSAILSIIRPQLLKGPVRGGGGGGSSTASSSSGGGGQGGEEPAAAQQQQNTWAVGQPSGTQPPSPPQLQRGDSTVPPSTVQMPDALLLLCPVLNLNRSPSPSRVAFASDTLLPQPLLTACAKAYDGGQDVAMWGDPLLSPALAPDEALRRLPTTHIQVGGFDPLLDDSVDFNTRIRRLGVPGELRIHRTLPHTFLSFPIWHNVPEVQQALGTTVQWLEDALWTKKHERFEWKSVHVV